MKIWTETHHIVEKRELRHLPEENRGISSIRASCRSSWLGGGRRRREVDSIGDEARRQASPGIRVHHFFADLFEPLKQAGSKESF